MRTRRNKKRINIDRLKKINKSIKFNRLKKIRSLNKANKKSFKKNTNIKKNKSYKNKKSRSYKKSRTYKKKEYKSGTGMLTTIWGPSMWLYLHTMSFNYPIKPTPSDKKNYKNFILNLQNVLPCGHCRNNFKKNLKSYPIKNCHMKDRVNFSRYVYKLHEIINNMLGKKSGLTYCDVRELYEHFRARCTKGKEKMVRMTRKKKEKGCTEPLYGKKAKCVIKIIPHEERCKTLQVDKQCIKRR